MKDRLAALLLAAIAAIAAPVATDAADDNRRVSQCLAMADMPARVQLAAYSPASLAAGEVAITYVTHSTYRIESSDGIVAATDFAGVAGQGKVPDVVTMNHAHATHFTYSPDPAIKHVLRGWNPKGGPAKHHLELGEFLIRNVTTDIHNFVGDLEPDGNSIFIFEVAGLCIGHLGHLHHHLTPQHYAKIGRLDVVMVPVDGTYTMSQAGMIALLKRVRASVILPMHAFGPNTMARFLAEMGKTFQVDFVEASSITLSLNALPARPTVKVLRGY